MSDCMISTDASEITMTTDTPSTPLPTRKKLPHPKTERPTTTTHPSNQTIMNQTTTILPLEPPTKPLYFQLTISVPTLCLFIFIIIVIFIFCYRRQRCVECQRCLKRRNKKKKYSPPVTPRLSLETISAESIELYNAQWPRPRSRTEV